MRARGWAGARVTRLPAPVLAALARRFRALWNFTLGGRQIERDPVSEGTAGRVRIIQDESKTMGVGRSAAPLDLRRSARAAASELGRDVTALANGGAGQNKTIRRGGQGSACQRERAGSGRG